MFKALPSDKANLLRSALLIFVAGVFVVATQTALFFHIFSPRVSQANIQLHELILEKAQKKLSTQIAKQFEALINTSSPADEAERTLAQAWRDFQNHFSVAPVEALNSLENELVVFTARNGDSDPANKLSNDIKRLQGMYADDHRPLLAELKRPPWYLWPTAPIVAAKSGYRQAATMNRAIYLAQTGEIGTARVMLAGLNASVDDVSVEAKIYYTLARLQFELFRRTPEADYYTQSVQYLRQSLRTDPGYPLAKRMLDFLLSLDQAATAPQSSEGRPESPSEGEGAAVSTDKRIF